MSILAFVVIGILAGFLAHAVMPNKQAMGLTATLLLGLTGSLVGGFLASVLSLRSEPLLLAPSGLLGSTVGAMVVLAVLASAGRRCVRL